MQNDDAKKTLSKDKLCQLHCSEQRQKARRAHAIHRCKEATQMGAPSRLKGPPQRTRAPVPERIGEFGTVERIEELEGRTAIVHKHFCEPMKFYWFGLRNETLEALAMIDGERVLEITWAFRKRTSCAEDQVVIEMLSELDMDMWEKCKLLSVQTVKLLAEGI